MVIRRALLAALLVLCVAFTACQRNPPLFDSPPNAIAAIGNHKLSLDEVRAAIMRGAASRKWTIQSQSPGIVTVEAVSRYKHEYGLTVDVHYTETSFTITYRDSYNLDYNAKNGTIHPTYGYWVRNLEAAIKLALLDAPRFSSGRQGASTP